MPNSSVALCSDKKIKLDNRPVGIHASLDNEGVLRWYDDKTNEPLMPVALDDIFRGNWISCSKDIERRKKQ